MRLETFQMIDRVVSFDKDSQNILTRSTVPDHSPVFEGHFPGHPLMPGVLLTETMAQASGYLILGLMNFSHMPFLMAVDKARFRTFIEPGAELMVEAHLDLLGSGYAATKAKLSSGGKAICDAQLRFRIMPFPDGLEHQMRAQAASMGLVTL